MRLLALAPILLLITVAMPSVLLDHTCVHPDANTIVCTAPTQPTPTPAPVFSTIQEAVDKATAGSTILIPTGIYREQVNIDKPVSLVSSGEVWIDGECTRDNGISIVNTDHVAVHNIRIRNTKGAGIRGEDVSNTKLIGNTIQDYNCDNNSWVPGRAGEQNQAGIAYWPGGSNHIVMSNTISRRSGTAVRGPGNGIWFKSDSAKPSGGGHIVTDNVISGGYDGIGTEVESDIRGGFDRDSVIARNTITNCQDDGIQVEGGTDNVKVQDNIIVDCGVGVALNPVLNGPLYIERNKIVSKLPGGPNNGVLACFKVGSPGNGIAYITDNYCEIRNEAGTQGNGIHQTNAQLANYVVRGNTFNVPRYVYLTNQVPGPRSVFENNCATDSVLVQWGGVRYNTAEAFRQATGQNIRC